VGLKLSFQNGEQLLMVNIFITLDIFALNVVSPPRLKKRRRRKVKNVLRDDLVEIFHQINMARKNIRDGNEGNIDARLIEAQKRLQGYISFTEYVRVYKQKRLKKLQHEIKGLKDTAIAMGIPHFKQEERTKLEDEVKRVNNNIF